MSTNKPDPELANVHTVDINETKLKELGKAGLELGKAGLELDEAGLELDEAGLELGEEGLELDEAGLELKSHNPDNEVFDPSKLTKKQKDYAISKGDYNQSRFSTASNIIITFRNLFPGYDNQWTTIRILKEVVTYTLGGGPLVNVYRYFWYKINLWNPKKSYEDNMIEFNSWLREKGLKQYVLPLYNKPLKPKGGKSRKSKKTRKQKNKKTRKQKARK